MDPLSAISSLIGGGLSFIGQSQANQINANATGASIDQKMAAAARYGISPLAMLGVQPVNAPASNVFSDAPATGQAIGRALAVQSPAQERLEALREQNMILQNANLQNDVIAGQLKNSQTNRVLAAVGSPPTYAAGTAGSPYAGPVDPAGGPNAEMVRMQTSEGVAYDASKLRSEQRFGGNLADMIADNMRSFGLTGLPYGWNLGTMLHPYVQRAIGALDYPGFGD